MTADLILAFAHIFAFIGVACFVAVVAMAARRNPTDSDLPGGATTTDTLPVVAAGDAGQVASTTRTTR